jgi:hypothetical protein
MYDRHIGPYEVTVRYVQSERETFNPNYSPPHTYSKTNSVDDGGTRIRPFEPTTFTTVPTPVTPDRPQSQKTVVYECVDYRIENGVLVITEKLGSPEGFMVPLSVIQEIRVARLKPKKVAANDFNFTERLKD